MTNLEGKIITVFCPECHRMLYEADNCPVTRRVAIGVAQDHYLAYQARHDIEVTAYTPQGIEQQCPNPPHRRQRKRAIFSE